MTLLGTMLCRQRFRRLQRQYGWPMMLSFAALALLVIGKLPNVIAHMTAAAPRLQVEAAADAAWLTWVVAGVITGRDLTWHVGIDRLIVFRIGFVRLYAIDLALSFLTLPLLTVFSIMAVAGVRAGWSGLQWMLALVAVAALICSVRASVSLGRAALFRTGSLSVRQRAFLYAVLAAIAILAIVPANTELRPGRALAAVLMQHEVFRYWIFLVIWACALAGADFVTVKAVAYSGVSGPPARATTHANRFSSGPLWRRVPLLWRVSMLGWLRNRSALLLLLWGAVYGFAWPYFSRVRGVDDFLPFIWMVMIFHGYLRGNLLGVDGSGLWLYATLGVTTDRLIRTKNATLTAVQVVMVGAVLLAAAIKPGPGVDTPLGWACLISFSAAGLLVGEIAGTILSIMHPERIDRTSLYSGGFTVGALLVPLLQLVLAAAFLVVFAITPAATQWTLFVAVPFSLALLKWRALPVWRATLLQREREEILGKLVAVSA